MPSTYTGSGIELIGDGEQSGSWGTTTNTNLQIINRLVSEAGTIALSGTTHTLTISDGTLSDGQYAVLVFGGAPSGTNTVTISPNDAKRVFIVRNSSGQSVVITQGSGGNVTVLNGRTAIVYADGAGSGAAVVNVSDDFIAPTLEAIGALTPTNNSFIVGNGTTWTAESSSAALQSLGVTATASELNVLDGITATTTELNYTDGVTANIQTQLNVKAAVTTSISAGAGLTGGGTLEANRTISHDDTSSQASVDNSGTTVIQDVTLDTFGHVTALGSKTLGLTDFGVTASAAELNKLDGVTATTAELNYTDGVTSNIQTQLNNKQPLDADLTAIAALTPTNNYYIVGNGTTWTAAELPPAGVLAVTAASPLASSGGTNPQISLTGTVAITNGGTGATSASAARTSLGVAIGSNVQAWDANLDQIAALTPTDGTFIVGNGTAWVAESGNTALTSLGVTATAAELNFVDGVTSNIQTQINDKVPDARTISAGSGLTGGGTLEANRTISHGDTSTQASVNNSGTAVIQDVTLDDFGHVTALGSKTLGLTDFSVTATATELNYTDGVTSNIQTQLNSKAATTTTISAGGGLTGGGDLSANRTLSHADTSSQASVNNSGSVYIQDITLDTYGHVTGITSTTVVPTTTQVLNATAGASLGAVGTYAFAATSGEGGFAAGRTVSGSTLQYAGGGNDANNGNLSIFERSGTLSGTWMQMGYQKEYQTNVKATLWLRIS